MRRLVSEAEFDAALSRIRAAGVAHYANFRRERPGEINHLYGGRGVYFDDPNGHLLELITRPYGPVPPKARLPAMSPPVTRVAVLPESVAVPRSVAPSKKRTVPAGAVGAD